VSKSITSFLNEREFCVTGRQRDERKLTRRAYRVRPWFARQRFNEAVMAAIPFSIRNVRGIMRWRVAEKDKTSTSTQDADCSRIPEVYIMSSASGVVRFRDLVLSNQTSNRKYFKRNGLRDQAKPHAAVLGSLELFSRRSSRRGKFHQARSRDVMRSMLAICTSPTILILDLL